MDTKTVKSEVMKKHTTIETEDGQTLHLINNRITDIDNADINILPINTKFYVKNGAWTGIIKQEEDGKHCSMSDGRDWHTDKVVRDLKIEGNNQWGIHIELLTPIKFSDDGKELVLMSNKEYEQSLEKEDINDFGYPISGEEYEDNER